MFRSDPFAPAMRLFVHVFSQAVVRPSLVTLAIGAMLVTASKPGSAVKPQPPQT